MSQDLLSPTPFVVVGEASKREWCSIPAMPEKLGETLVSVGRRRGPFHKWRRRRKSVVCILFCLLKGSNVAHQRLSLKRRQTLGDALSKSQSVSRPGRLVTIGTRISEGSASIDAVGDEQNVFER